MKLSTCNGVFVPVFVMLKVLVLPTGALTVKLLMLSKAAEVSESIVTVLVVTLVRRIAD
ncbi:MAG TPA: hypothetical protein VL171_13500 [Verrucomicrobiae bacterium]|nr:hypothetical protein [Verrucomicrobiae bacterium]